MSEISLFDPITVGSVELKNRVIMAPLTRCRAVEGLVPNPLAVTYYRQRANAGLILSEATQIMQQGQGYSNTPGIYSPEQVRGWQAVTDAVHADGGKIFLQLWHVGRISHSDFQPGNALPVAPSAIAAVGEVTTPSGKKPYEVPHALTIDEIKGIIRQYGVAAQNANDAGFDGVQVHAANSYLIDQFLRDGVNKRTDEYGGSLENRARFLFEAVEAVVNVWGSDRVAVRLSPRVDNPNMQDSNPLETFTFAVAGLNRFNLAFLEVREPITHDESYISPHLRKSFHNAFFVNQGYTLETATNALKTGLADAVAFGVPYIANPDLVERFKRNGPYNESDRSTFYGSGAHGYTDYPTLEEAK